MNQNQVIAQMKKQLDWNAKEYDIYEDLEVKESIAKEFKIEAKAYNSLLKGMYKTIKYEVLFASKIENYIIQRKCEDWA